VVVDSLLIEDVLIVRLAPPHLICNGAHDPSRASTGELFARICKAGDNLVQDERLQSNGLINTVPM